MQKKIMSLLLATSLCFTLSASVFAESAPTPSTQAKYSLENVVPSTYFMKYKGQFQTFDQVYATFGKKVRPATTEEKTKGEVAYSVKNPDELAALLAFLNDQKQLLQNSLSEPQIVSVGNTLAAEVQTDTYEQTIYDNSLYWIKGYVTIDYVPRTGKITKTTARSALLGLTYGHTWKPDSPRITVVSDQKRKVVFTGTITSSVNVGGEIEVWNDNVNATMLVQSIPLIEKP
ncbi:small-conductance mechanosensitive channel [Paenibacillus alvei]|uniref:Small-conductance mechanosensitive channel n=1 Tax=Paenibacillus alvei TaxID=44250 RepID=A0ABT4H178_PAEAL|nr:hypothetical protein [Paenibacillus alvei]EJW13769.1 hypothetical protein PAV_16p00170 [Paenibacillus alvei DSM 29]MCY9540755.1 small-conductance mechanosensitive channel [Paenibacillus alvei]MCY9702610.1 small-conductance mechanosensitive channel [Paenibacillus alvei]MCY9732138.1 small-conductance mechanosensitive channel [Paenibacillus alvei]MCY9752760.1 small-conductance mechanosensitive channel [Paenibacillus alvei]